MLKKIFIDFLHNSQLSRAPSDRIAHIEKENFTSQHTAERKKRFNSASSCIRLFQPRHLEVKTTEKIARK